MLGRTRDYTQRLLDFSLLGAGTPTNGKNGIALTPNPLIMPTMGPLIPTALPRERGRMLPPPRTGEGLGVGASPSFPKVADTMRAAGLIAPLREPDPPSSRRTSPSTPSATRPPSGPAQLLARGESGAMLSFAYASLRAFGGGDHATVAELRVGDLPLQVVHPLLGTPVTIGRYRVTETEMLGPDRDKHVPGKTHAGYSLSYGLVFGQHERKAISMAILDSTLMATEGQERPRGSWSPAGDEEMVLSHIDPIETSGFVEHLKLPHYVTFGSSLQGTLAMQAEQNLPSPAHDTGRRRSRGAPCWVVTGRRRSRGAPCGGMGGGRGEAAQPRGPMVGHRGEGDDHHGIAAGQLHHHGDGVLHAHDD